jgi:hypothetical protein
MKAHRTVRLLWAWVFISVAVIPGVAQVKELKLALVRQEENPVITINSPGAEGIKLGFEGGCVIKLQDTYHLFTSEMMDRPLGVKMRLGYWTSGDRLHWKRTSTLYESSAEYAGKDPRAALWAPMAIYDDREERWNLFYVAYRCAPSTAEKWLENYDGEIWRAVSKVRGREGIGGPYEDVGVILQPGSESQAWEGLQGTDSFFPYKVGATWYGFYGSADTQKKPVRAWKVGLASSPHLAGPWTRRPEGNPIMIEKVFIENPVVTKLRDGTFVAVYNGIVPNAIGYTFSRDGIHWELGQALVVQPKGKGHWADVIRTPMGLIPEGDDNFTLFYTGIRRTQATPSQPATFHDVAVGLVTVRLTHSDPSTP